MVDWGRLEPTQLIQKEQEAHVRSLKWFRNLLKEM